MGRYKFWISIMKELSLGIGYEKENDGHIFLLRILCFEIIYATNGVGIFLFKD